MMIRTKHQTADPGEFGEEFLDIPAHVELLRYREVRCPSVRECVF